MATQPSHLPRLRVAETKRHLVHENGAPFFYLGDTAWELFHRLTRDEAIAYLENRKRLGYTVIQAVALAELDGLRTPNAGGHHPLEENDPTRPRLVPGADNDYWDHVDFIVQEANARGLYVGLLPTWGDKWFMSGWGAGPEIFTPANAESYGAWIGERYRDAGIIWIMGGDRPIETDVQRTVVQNMARGVRRATGGRQLMTFHPPGGSGSSQWFHDEDWLDFNMRQNGHMAAYNGRYDQTRADYERTPVKPVLDGEPIYEGHPIEFDSSRFGVSCASDVRRPLYWNLFGGACGHTYGHHSVWQMYDLNRDPVNNPIMTWKEAVNEPGAAQMQHGRRLIESRPILTRIPTDDLIVPHKVPAVIPGAGLSFACATRDTEGSFAMIYLPVSRPVTVRLSTLRAGQIQAWWFDPRTGTHIDLGLLPGAGERAFTPPDLGEMRDWILVLDDASKGYPAPGTAVWSGNL